MKTFTIGVIAGDGVGQEVIPQAKRVAGAVAQKHDDASRSRISTGARSIISAGDA